MRHWWVLIMAAWSIATIGSAQQLPLEKIKLPQGFAIEVVARVDNARGMTFGDKGTLFVGSTRAGKVYAIRFGNVVAGAGVHRRFRAAASGRGRFP